LKGTKNLKKTEITKMINPIDTNNWKPVLGDDIPYSTMRLRDAPTGYHFANITMDENLTETYAIKDTLLDYAERYYRDWEINAPTLASFLDGLQLAYDTNKLVFEKMLETIKTVKFDKGQTTIKERDLNINDDNLTVDSGISTRTDNLTENVDYEESFIHNEDNELTTNETDKNIEIAFDSTNEDASTKITKDATQTENKDIDDSKESAQVRTNTGTVADESDNNRTENKAHEESEIETVNIDRFAGENSLDYYKDLMENYPNIFKKFVEMFIDEFIIKEVIIW